MEIFLRGFAIEKIGKSQCWVQNLIDKMGTNWEAIFVGLAYISVLSVMDCQESSTKQEQDSMEKDDLYDGELKSFWLHSCHGKLLELKLEEMISSNAYRPQGRVHVCGSAQVMCSAQGPQKRHLPAQSNPKERSCWMESLYR
jgi:hypothetical protein